MAESRQLKDQISKVIQENDSLKAANENLQGRLRNIDQNIEQKLNNTAQELQQQQENRSQTILDQVQKRLENLTHIPEAGDTDLPVGSACDQRMASTFRSGLVFIGYRLDRAPGRPRGRCQWPAAGRRLHHPTERIQLPDLLRQCGRSRTERAGADR